MKGTIANFRSGRHTQNTSHMIISINEVTDREKAAALVGKNVSWKSPAGKEIKGKITKEHGNSGAVKVLFEKGMPGQSIGTSIEIQ